MECKICGNAENNTTYIAKEMMLGFRDEHEYIQCSACNCLQIVNIPDNLPEYYPNEDYYSYASVAETNALKKFLLKKRDYYAATGKGFIGKLLSIKNPQAKLETLQPLHLNRHSKILDVGCGAGHLLNSLKEAGFTQLLGIDPFNAEEIRHPNGLQILKQSIFEAEGSWDLIMMNHSYEHVTEQLETLQAIASKLEPTGTCMIRVPTVSSWAWQEYGIDWVQLDAPRHLFLHSLKSMEKLAADSGMFIEQIAYDSFGFQFWGSEQYRQDIPLNDERSYAVNPKKSLFNAAQIKDFEHRSQELNANQQGDQVVFYLKKSA